MLDGLKESLGAAIKKIVKSSGIDEELIKELSKDVQRALLQSDVNVRLVLEITKQLEERALNETPPPGLSRKDHIIKILYDELSKLLGNESDFEFKPRKHGYAIKIPVFSFDKFPNVNKELGPEMKSTGEAIYFIDDLKDDYFTKVYSERNLYLSK